MLTMHKDNYEITVCDPFTEDLVDILRKNNHLLATDVEEHLCDRIIYQEKDSSSYYTFIFNKSDFYKVLSTEQVIQFSIPKLFVSVKVKSPIKIREGSCFESLNEDDAFLKALNEEYRENCRMYAYYLPVTYNKKIPNKYEDDTSSITLHVDIPFSELEFSN